MPGEGGPSTASQMASTQHTAASIYISISMPHVAHISHLTRTVPMQIS
jgi:hypothetical protein